jgi:hypothetical protein
MINHGGGRDGFGAKKGFFAALDPSPDVLHGGCMNGFLAICCIRREIMS